jgi:DNA modification methylase
LNTVRGVKPSLKFAQSLPTHSSPLAVYADKPEQWAVGFANSELTGQGMYVLGDNLLGLQALQAGLSEQITLAYLDPPFFTGRVFQHKARATGLVQTAFDDRWEDRQAYLQALEERLRALRPLLAPHGSVVVHVDPKTSHYVKIMCDQIFGEECFASEIIWRYRRWPSKTDNFQRVHDVLLRYRKDASAKPRWNPLYEPLAPSTVATWGLTKQRAVFDKTGKRLRSSKEEKPSQGVPMGDVWDIGILAPVARERTGYPSQKPELLLERIVSSLSSEGDIVLDPYAGSGTTLSVAARLGRRFIGVDASPVSKEVLLPRLQAQGCALHEVGGFPVAPPRSEPRLRTKRPADGRNDRVPGRKL